MILFKKILLVTIFYFTTGSSIAQQINIVNNTNKYHAVHWGVDEGLGKARWHNAIIKDVNSFMWFGSSQGEPSRFDGNSFKRYYSDKNIAGTIRSDHCLAMIEDSLHNIWIGATDGLSRYDIKADTFTNFFLHSDSGASNECIPFWATNNDVFCIEGGNQVTKYNVYSFERKKLLDIKKSDSVGIDIPQVSYAIFNAQSNSIWMLLDGKEGLLQISLSSGKRTFHRRIVDFKKPDLWGHINAEAMCYDKNRNCFWINSHDGLIQFTLNDEEFHPIAALDPFVNVKGYARMVGIDIDQKGRIWIATVPKGILIYDPSNASVSKLFSDTLQQQELSDGNLKIYCDRDGIVWTSYFELKEIYQLIPFSPSVCSYTANPHHPDSLSSLDIINMVPGEHGQLWIGTLDGLNIYSPQTGTFSVVREKDLRGMKGNGIIPMVIDTLKKKAWINADPDDQVYEMDIQTKKCKPLIFKDAENHAISTHNIINDVSAPVKNGIIFLDALHGIFEASNDSNVARLVIPFQDMYLNKLFIKMIVVDDSILFLKTFPHSITYFNIYGKWVKKTYITDSIAWTEMYYDASNRTYWVAADGDIIHYDKNFCIIRKYSDADGLMREVLTILPDNSGNIWFNTDRKTVGNLNIKTGIIATLSEKDGYQKQWYDIFTPLARELGGDLYFVGNRLAPGISLERISPAKFINAPTPSSAYIKSIKINQKDFPLPTGINNLQKLSLHYTENNIIIETGTIDYYSKGKNNIRFRLEGGGIKNSNWQYEPVNYTIYYEQLPPGNYR